MFLPSAIKSISPMTPGGEPAPSPRTWFSSTLGSSPPCWPPAVCSWSSVPPRWSTVWWAASVEPAGTKGWDGAQLICTSNHQQENFNSSCFFFLFPLTATVSSLTSRWRTLLEEVCICLQYSVKSEMSKLFFKGLTQRKCINYLIKKINIIQQDQQRLWEAYCGIPFF